MLLTGCWLAANDVFVMGVMLLPIAGDGDLMEPTGVTHGLHTPPPLQYRKSKIQELLTEQIFQQPEKLPLNNKFKCCSGSNNGILGFFVAQIE